MARKRSERQIVSAEDRRLLDLMDLPESHLTVSELAELDAFIAAKTAAIRAHWTPEQEAMARGVRFRNARDKQYEFDGRLFQSVPVGVVDSREAESLLDDD